MNTSAIRARLVHDVTDTDCQTLTVSVHGLFVVFFFFFFATFKRRYLTNQTINRVNFFLLFLTFLKNSIPIFRARNTASLGDPFKSER